MVPVPGVYLGAVARATTRMRLGPLVYLLPLYSPLRLIEEICMLDHLSHGRLDVGIGRGVSPYELKYHKVEHDQSRDIFIDAFRLRQRRLITDSLSYKGEQLTSMRTCRSRCDRCSSRIRRSGTPHRTRSVRPGAASRACTMSLWVRRRSPKPISMPTRRRSTKRGAPVQPKAEFPGGAAIGVQRHIFVADTDAEARRFGKPAMDLHLAHINWLRTKHGQTGLT